MDIDSVLAEAAALAEEAAGQLNSDSPADVSGESPGYTPEYDTGTVRRPAPPMRPSGVRPPGAIQRVLKLDVPVVVRLAQRTMLIGDVLDVSVGTIIEFDKPFDAELDLLVNNRLIGSGQAVKVGEKFGLRVINIGGLKDRIDALGGA